MKDFECLQLYSSLLLNNEVWKYYFGIYPCQKCWFLLHPQPLLGLSQIVDPEALEGQGSQISLRKDSATLPQYYIVLSASFQSFLTKIPRSKAPTVFWQKLWRQRSGHIQSRQYSVLWAPSPPGGSTAVALLRLALGAPVGMATFCLPHQDLYHLLPVIFLHALLGEYMLCSLCS